MQPSLLRTISIGAFLGFMTVPGTGAPSRPSGSVRVYLTAGQPALDPLGEKGQVVPRIAGFGLTSRPGEPMLPLKVLMVAVPEGSVPEIKILSAPARIIRDLNVAPVPRLRARERAENGESRETENDFAADNRVFGLDREFPSSPVRLGVTGYLREQRFVEVIFSPVVYNPARKQARFFPEITAEVTFTWPESISLASVGAPPRPDPQFEDVYRRSFLNYEQGKLYRVSGAETPRTGAPLTGETTRVFVSTAPAAGEVAGTARYKIMVSRAGIYRMNYSYLQANAPEILGFNPQTLMLSSEGVEVPISIRDQAGGSGEADGQFGTGDYLEFYGRPKTEPATLLNYDYTSTFPDIFQANDFTDTQVYWLTSTGAPGSHARIPSADGTPGSPGFAVANSFEEAAVWDENNLYLPLADADPFFSIPSLLAGSTQAQRDITLALAGIASGADTVNVKVRLRGGSNLSLSPDHRTQVRINNDAAGSIDFTWDGEVIREQDFTTSQSVLTNPTTIHFTVPVVSGVSIDRQYIDTVTIRYRRSFTAVGDVLAFSYPNQDVRFQVVGFSGASPTIYEVSRTLPGSGEASPVRIVGAAVSGFPTTSYTFDVPRDASPSPPASRSFIVAGPGGLRIPDAIARAADPVLRDPQKSADIVVIAARSTVDTSAGGSLDNLLAHRLQAQGLTSTVVFVDQIYDEFSYGQRDVNAFRSFLNYAFDNWKGTSGVAPPPSFVLLVGDATPDYKNTLNRADWVDQVPTPMMFQSNSILGYYSSDNLIASFRGTDQIPDIYLGRISTRSAAASASVFDKILRYEQSPPPGLWKGRAVLTAGDGKSASEAADFEAIQDRLAAIDFSAAPYSVPNPPLYYAHPPWNSTDAAGFKNALVAELQGGAAVLSFVGHGSFETWGANTFFTTSDAEALTNDRSLPFMININCLAGGFHFLFPSGSLGEGMTNNPAGGAIATLAPSGLSNSFVGDLITDELFGPMFGPERERVLGAATAALRSVLWAQGSIVELQSFTYLGDPATVIATPAPPPPTAVSTTAGNGEVVLSWTPSASPSAGYHVYRSASGPSGPYTLIVCDALTATSCVDRTVLNATTYYYYVVSADAEGFEGRASNFNSGCNDGSDCVAATPINPGPPSVPVGLASRDPGSGGRLEVSWQPNTERDLKSYALNYGTLPGQYTTRLVLGATTTSTVLTGLSNGTRYYLALSATNTSGHESNLSAEISDVPHLIQGIAPPRAISDLRIDRSGSDLVLNWSRPTLDIYGRPTTVVRYDIYRGNSPGFQTSAASRLATVLNGALTTFSDSNAALLPPNLYYIVTATDDGGLVSGAGRDLPNGIETLAVLLLDSSRVRLSWPAVMTDIEGLPTIIDHYQVHMSGSPLPRASLGASTLALDNVRALSANLTVPSGNLYFSVIAVDNRGNLSPF